MPMGKKMLIKENMSTFFVGGWESMNCLKHKYKRILTKRIQALPPTIPVN
jgi:hypothetical protein